MEDEEEQEGEYEIEVRDGLELRYRTGKPGHYMSASPSAWASGSEDLLPGAHLRHQAQGKQGRQYGLGTYSSAVKAAIAIAN